MDIKQKSIYWCRTRYNAEDFAQRCVEKGFVWKNGIAVSENTLWDQFGSETCYKTNTGNITFADRDTYKNDGRTIIEYVPNIRKISEEDELLRVDNIFVFNELLREFSADGFRSMVQGTGEVRNVLDALYVWNIHKKDTIIIKTPDKFILTCDISVIEKKGRTGEIQQITRDVPTFAVGDLVEYNSRKYAIVDIGDGINVSVSNIDTSGTRISLFSSKKLVGDEYKIDKAVGDSVLFCVSSNEKICGSVVRRISDYAIVVKDCLYNNEVTILAENLREFGETSETFKSIENGDFVYASKAQINYSRDGVKSDILLNIINKSKKFAECRDRQGNSFVITCDEDIRKVEIEQPPQRVFTSIVDNTRLKQIVNDAISVYNLHKYKDVTELGVTKFIERWNKNKSYLANLLRKHPDWDEENLCVSYIGDDVRDGDYQERRQALDNFRYNLLCSNDRVVNCVLSSDEMYDSSKSGYANDTLRNYISYVNEEYGKKISCNVGAKLTRVIRNICTEFGVDKYINFEKHFAELSDKISVSTLRRRFVLSINPLDFLLMSNGNSWSSCHFLDGGNSGKCYQAGTQSYAQDTVSMIFYVLPLDGKGDYYSQPKLKRQIFCYKDDALLQSRLYPNASLTEFSIISRAFVKDILSKCLETDDKWTDYDDGSRRYADHFATTRGATHYLDYTYNSYNIKISKLGTREYPFVCKGEIGEQTICPVCGEPSNETHDCRCRKCYKR